MPELAFVNGSFCPIDQARISIEDRGFQFADGVYEVIVFHGERPVLLDEHLDRLKRSCRGIRLEVDWQMLQIAAIIREGVRRAAFEHTLVYLQLTRGVAPRNHVFPPECRPTLILTFKPAPVVPREKRTNGIRIKTLPDFRWKRCDIKSIALLPNVLARNEALASGYDDALFVGPLGEVREASAANVFAVQDRRLFTPPQDHSILPGITRRFVAGSARKLELTLIERPFDVTELSQVDELFLCSTTIDVLAVVEVDQVRIADGRPGPLTMAIYQQMQLDLELSA